MMEDLDESDLPPFLSPRESVAESIPDKPKWVTAKTNAIKEIEEWATDNLSGGLTHELARTTGQLPDNVTEARLLKAKIYELSKERYKFKAQTEFEKKMFLDRQQRKTTYLKDLLRGVPVEPHLRRQSWTAPTGTERSSSGAPQSARMAFLNRMDVSRSSDRPKEVLAAEEQIARELEEKRQQRPQLRMPQIKSVSAKGVRRRQTMPPKSASSTKSASLYSTEPGLKQSEHSQTLQKLPDVKTEASGTISLLQAADSDDDDDVIVSSSGPPPAGRQNLLRKRDEERVKSKVQFADLPPATRAPTPKKRKGPVSDSRFYSLTNALSGVYTCERPVEVSTIVQSFDALHAKPKNPQDSRPKITKKIKEFMRARGIVF